MQTRRLWRRGAALAGGFTVGFVCFYALRQPPYDPPRARRLQEWDGEKVRPDGTGIRPLRCFQGYTQIQGGGHWTQGAVVHNASLPSDGAHLHLADHALLLSNARVRPVSLAATDEAGILKTCSTVSTATVRTSENRCVLLAQTNSQARPHQVLSYTRENDKWRLAPAAPRGAFPAASPRFALQRAARQNALIRATPRLAKVIDAACAAASLEPHAASTSVAMALDGKGLPMFGSVRDAVRATKPRRRVVLLAAATVDVVNVLNLVASARMHGPYKAVVAAADGRAAAALRGVVGLEVIADAALNGDAHWARLAALSLVTTLGYDVLSLDTRAEFAVDPERLWSALYDTSAEAAFRYDGGAAGPLPIDAGVMLLRGGERSAAVADLLLTQASLAAARGSFKDVVDAVLPEARALMALSVAQSALPGLLSRWDSVLPVDWYISVECAETFAAAALQDMPAHVIEGLPAEECARRPSSATSSRPLSTLCC